MEIQTKKSTHNAVEFLRSNATEKEWDMIIESLVYAYKKAKESLNKELFVALTWPIDKASYFDYLNEFIKWIPQQSDKDAWKKPGTLHSQEVYDRLCHFYFLVDQETSKGVLAQDIPWFSEFLVRFAIDWGSYLDTPESFNDDILESFIKYSPQYRVQDSLIDGKPIDPWNSFNDFFSRRLKPGLRPIDSPDNNSVVTMPADSTYRNKFEIDSDSKIEKIKIKQTHKYGSIEELLESDQYGKSFANGTFVHYFLGPYSYHRFHTPVSGTVKECKALQGATFLEVNISGDRQFDAPDNAENGYEFLQARGVIIIDTTDSPDGDMGIVAVIPVGMCQVSSVHMTAEVGSYTKKGDEFGHFQFGGSDIILLFQKGKCPEIDECSNYRHYGNDISTCPPVYPL